MNKIKLISLASALGLTVFNPLFGMDKIDARPPSLALNLVVPTEGCARIPNLADDALRIILFHAVHTKGDFLNLSLSCKYVYRLLPQVAKIYHLEYLRRINENANDPETMTDLETSFGSSSIRCNEFSIYMGLEDEKGVFNQEAIDRFEKQHGPCMQLWLRGRFDNAFNSEYLELQYTFERRIEALSFPKYFMNGYWRFGHTNRREFIKLLPEILCQSINCTNLLLADAKLRALSPTVGQMTNLKQLDLACNKLETLPSEIGSLSNLEHFSVQGNLLTTLCPQVFDLQALTTLNLSANRFTKLPEGISKLSNLTWLLLGGNQLVSLPEEMWTMHTLEKLDLGSNQLEELSDRICDLQGLKDLNLSGNKIAIMPVRFSTMPNIEKLNLDMNPVQNLEALFLDLGQFMG